MMSTEGLVQKSQFLSVSTRIKRHGKDRLQLICTTMRHVQQTAGTTSRKERNTTFFVVVKL
jgi:hypothetical protein